MKKEASKEKLVGYRSVLDSMSTEESLVCFHCNWIYHQAHNHNIMLLCFFLQVNYARWEPAHGCFSFKHPWKDYLELGALLRSYANCIDALSGIVSDTKVMSESHWFETWLDLFDSTTLADFSNHRRQLSWRGNSAPCVWSWAWIPQQSYGSWWSLSAHQQNHPRSVLG